MIFESIEPDVRLHRLVKEFWIIEDGSSEREQRKIVPDGYPEIIFHYGDPWRIRLQGEWETQENALFAGQITSYFYLENTGRTGMIGIKLQPAAPALLGVNDMNPFTDRVVPLTEVAKDLFPGFVKQMGARLNPGGRAKLAEKHLLELVNTETEAKGDVTQRAVQQILQSRGSLMIGSLAEELEVSSRHLERSFKQSVGLTPKFYCRIIRFNHIFEVMRDGNNSWIDIALDAGYFDQSHFIREFKAFTGEEPSRYGYDEKTIANFFLKRN